MLQALRKLLGLQPATNFAALLQHGAIIVDVRSRAEYSNGHIEGAINIPLDLLTNNLPQLADKNNPIITCCASGIRSISAKSMLHSNGYMQVFNGGGWRNLQQKIK
jgi:phage shock protein E